MRIMAWGVSDTGQQRDHNEDALLINGELNLFAVADGMGGHLGGARASRMAVEVIEGEIGSAGRRSSAAAGPSLDDPVARELVKAVKIASRAVHDAGQASVKLAGMGTTVTTLLLRQGRGYVAHVGDSRCYLYRDGHIEQLTEDHSWIEEQIRAGYMSREEAEQSGLKHIVTRSVGFEREVDVDTLVIPALMGDCYLLCSDGLSNHLNDQQLRDFLLKGYYSEVPRRLIATANKLGGDDNITALVVYIANDRKLEHASADLAGGQDNEGSDSADA